MHGVIASLNILLIGRNVKQYVVLLFALFLLAGCSPAPEVGGASVNESASVFNDEQIKSQIESSIARSADLPQQIGVQVREVVVTISGT